jgi:hypothetical protein
MSDPSFPGALEESVPAATENPILEPKPPAEEPLRSVHTTSFPELLRTLGISLAVTTYQAGKLLFLRADGDVLNTHFRHFPRPMGLAYKPG